MSVGAFCCSIKSDGNHVWSAEKRENVAARGLSFELVEALEWGTALVKADTRRDYGETRLQVLALLDGRRCAVVVTPRGADLRVISFRRASRREVRLYGKTGR